MQIQAIDENTAHVFLYRSRETGKLRVSMSDKIKHCDMIGQVATARPDYVQNKLRRLGICDMMEDAAMALLAIYGEVLSPVVQ